MYIQEMWTNVGLDFLLSVWLIETVASAFLKQVFLVILFLMVQELHPWNWLAREHFKII